MPCTRGQDLCCISNGTARIRPGILGQTSRRKPEFRRHAWRSLTGFQTARCRHVGCRPANRGGFYAPGAVLSSFLFYRGLYFRKFGELPGSALRVDWSIIYEYLKATISIRDKSERAQTLFISE